MFLQTFLEATSDFFQLKAQEKVKKEAEVRKGILTILNNRKQKLKKLKTSNKVAAVPYYP